MKSLEQKLLQLKEKNLFRQRRIVQSPCQTTLEINREPILSFSSNDYLGLASHPLLAQVAANAAKKWGVGSGGSHAVTGHMLPHDNLEKKLARFVQSEKALFFSTGFMANTGIVPTLVGRGDAVFSDRLNHASLIDAVLLSRAEHFRYRHNDIEHLESLLKKHKAPHQLILTDAVFSMDGDIAPIPELLKLANAYDAWLVVDDAHGFGVLGENGQGTLSHFHLPIENRLIYIGTLGKAAGVSGAFIAGDETVIDYIQQTARTYIFTTASSPMIAETLIKSIEIIQDESFRRDNLFALIDQLTQGLKETKWQHLASPTAIQPVIIGENEAVLRVSEKLYQKGIFVPAIRPPTVPKGLARLRISLSATHTPEEIDQLIKALKDIQ